MTEIAEGYKKTDAGVISTDWQAKKLSELFKFKNGVNADKKYYGKGIKFINILEIIQNNSLFYDDIPGFITLEPESIKSNLVQKGDVLFNRTSETQEEIGLTAVYLDEKEVVFGGFVIRARPINDEIDYYFSKYGFSSVSVRNQIIRRGQGAIRANIGQSDLKEILIPLPPLPEQKAIAQALSDVDTAIAEIDRLITKKRNIKQGTMQQLLTGKRRLAGFRGDWSWVKSGEVIRFFGGNAFSSKAQKKDGIRWLKIANVGIEEIKWDEIAYLPHHYEIDFSDYLLNEGDVVMALTRPILSKKLKISKLSSNDIPSLLNQRVAKLITDELTELDYIYYVLQMPYFVNSMSAAMAGSDPPNIGSKTLESLSIPLPPTIEEQKAIAQVLTDMDIEIEALEQKRNKYKTIKQGMMQELLTGRTRLV